MSDTAQLLAIGDRLVADAKGGEQVEVVVVHSAETEVKVFEQEIESLSSAEARGVGVRVVVDGKQGFAYAGSFEPDDLRQALVEAFDLDTQQLYVVDGPVNLSRLMQVYQDVAAPTLTGTDAAMYPGLVNVIV